MSVTQTRDPDTLKLSFLTTDLPLTQVETIVYAHSNQDGKVEFHYSHQIIRERHLENAPWDERETVVRSPLTRSLAEQIRSGAIMELANDTFTDVVELNGPVGKDPTMMGWAG
jgi:hypothetical protein